MNYFTNQVINSKYLFKAIIIKIRIFTATPILESGQQRIQKRSDMIEIYNASISQREIPIIRAIPIKIKHIVRRSQTIPMMRIPVSFTLTFPFKIVVL